MSRDSGFLIVDALVIIFFVSLAASSGYSILTASLRQSSKSTWLMMAGCAADGTICMTKTAGRGLSNPGGLPVEAGNFTDTVTFSNRQFRTTITKEVSEECPGLYRWVVTVKPLLPTEDPPKPETVRYLTGSYDPF